MLNQTSGSSIKGVWKIFLNTRLDIHDAAGLVQHQFSHTKTYTSLPDTSTWAQAVFLYTPADLEALWQAFKLRGHLNHMRISEMIWTSIAWTECATMRDNI